MENLAPILRSVINIRDGSPAEMILSFSNVDDDSQGINYNIVNMSGEVEAAYTDFLSYQKVSDILFELGYIREPAY